MHMGKNTTSKIDPFSLVVLCSGYFSNVRQKGTWQQESRAAVVEGQGVEGAGRAARTQSSSLSPFLLPVGPFMLQVMKRS